MRIGNLSGFIKKFEMTTENTANTENSSKLIRYFLDSGKLLVMYVIIFQLMMQPIAALSQSKGVTLDSRQPIAQKSNVKAKVEENTFEDFLPKFEKKTRKAISDAFGTNVPLPQVFGENGKLGSLFSGGSQPTDKNQELIEMALNGGPSGESAMRQPVIEKKPTETVISLNAPTLNSGLIEGDLRVVKESSFTFGENFRLSRNLYTVGAPSISTQNDSNLNKVIDEETDDSSNEYQVNLNGGEIGGNIYIHSVAENITTDIPSALPNSNGAEYLEINSAADLKNVKDWAAFGNITINAANLDISIPAGNYQNITLNAPNRLVFGSGNYNFSDTIDFQKGGSILINGQATVGIGGNLVLENVSVKNGAKVLPEDVKFNILGSSVIVGEKSEINGLIRAINANVTVENEAKIVGQVIADSVLMNGGTVTNLFAGSRKLFAPTTNDNLAVVKDGMTHNGRIEGSVQQLSGLNTILNSGAVITGDLLVPGVPQLVRNGTGTFSGTVTGTGAATPTGYQVTLNSTSTLRNLKTRINPQTMPNIAAPPTTTGTVSAVVNNSSQYPTNFTTLKDLTMNSGAGVLTLPGGTYRNIAVNSNSGIKIGIAGQTTPVTYNLAALTVNSGSQVQIVGPVILNLGSGLTLNATMGVLNNPEWLKIRVSTGGVTVNSSGISLYGGVIAPVGIVTINSNTNLIGNVACKTLVVNSGGLLRNALPNLLSDTAVSITSPANNSTTASALTTVSGTAQSSVGIVNVFVNERAAAYSSTNNTWTIADVALSVGSNVITVRAVDGLGGEVVSQITVTRQPPATDTTAPGIAINSPANNSTTQAQTITVSGTAADAGINPSGIASVSVNGQNATLSANGNWTISGIALVLGANTITARATDNAGNFSNTTITVTRQSPDTTAPTLTIVSPANNSTTTNATTAVSGTVADTGANASGVAGVTVNGQNATVTNGTWTIANVALTVGANVIVVRALDNAGNVGTQQITVTRNQPDTTAPTITISTPANNSETTATTVSVSGTAVDSGTNASGVAAVKVNGQTAALNGSNWTIADFALALGSNTITVTATDNAGNAGNAVVTVVRKDPDTTPPTVSITTPANNSETTDSTTAVSGTVSDSGANASGVATVSVNGQSAVITGSNWTLNNFVLVLGSNTITVTATDIAGNAANSVVTVRRIEPDATAPTVAITSPANNSETTDTSVSVSGTATDPGTNASGVQSVTVNGQSANFSNGNWTISSLSLNLGNNTITARAADNAGNVSETSIIVVRREPDTTPPTVSITSPNNNLQTIAQTITVSGTVVDSGANASGVASVNVNGISATINGGTWTAAGVPLSINSNTITARAADNAGNISNAAITVVRNPLDTQAPTLTITSPVNNFETFDSQVIVTGTVVDEGAGATGVSGVTVNGVAATYNVGANSWAATVSIVDGVNTITAVATDYAPTPNQSQASVQVRKITVQPPTVSITNPANGAFLSTNSVTVAGGVSSNKSDMTFAVTVNGQAANLAGREYTKTLNLNEGTNVITAVVTDALGQQAQQSITVTNDRTPPTVYLINVPPVVNPGESYTIGAVAADAYGIADVEFTVNGASITRSSVAPFQFTLNIPLLQQPNVNLNISAIARDNAGLSATATARSITSGPSGLTGYVFDDATGYVLPNADARLNNQTPLPTDENGLYSFISSSASGIVLISKPGYTTVERSYSTTAGSGVEVFDARLTPLDSKTNTADQNGSVAASDSANRIQAQFAPNSFPNGTDVRLTSVSPQGLANLLPFGWSPIPDAVIDVRAAGDAAFSNRSYPNPATLTVLRVESLSSSQPVVLARYNSATHNWIVLQKDVFASAGGTLQASISADGQYAFLVPDSGVTAPPNAVAGQNLPAAAAANSEQLDSATASAYSSPATALFSNTAKSRITFTANSTAKLPSGVSIEASFGDSYTPLVDPRTITVDRPSQDFVVYSFPSVSAEDPNKLGAFFVAKPVRTDFGLSDLLKAKVHVEIYSGRLSQAGVLIGTTGGTVRGAEGSELEIPGGSIGNPQIVFFNKIPVNQTGVILPAGYDVVGAFEVNLAGNTLGQTARISMPAISGDNSKIVVAKVISIAGQPGLKVVGRVVENNSRLQSSVSQPSVPSGVNLVGIKDSGKYLFVKMPGEFGYIKGTVSSATQNTQAVKVTNTNTPFVDATVNNGTYTIPGLANGESIQADGVSLTNDATGYATTLLSAQNTVVNLPITLSSAALSVAAVTPINAATSVIVTTPVTVTFNKPISGSSVTGSNIKLVTSNGNPVITNITTVAGGRSVVLTPASSLQSETTYKVQVSTGIRDIYGNPLANAFESSFRTTNLVTVSNRLQPSQIRIAYPNEQGFSTISIPAGAIPVGSVILAINNSTGSTVSMIAGSGAVEIQIPARVGDEIELIIRQPDGAEYRVKQAAYRRADGFVSVGSNGGAITSDDGSLVLQVPPGAISGQADVKMTVAPESSISVPREGEMAPGEMGYIGGVKIEARGTYTNTEELHLELPAPANAPEGQRALAMKPSRINYNGSEIDSWETITSAKVESGKIKTTSPPFFGVTLAGVLLGLSIGLSVYFFIPQRQRLVTGLVRKQISDGTYQLVTGGKCYIVIGNQVQTNVFGEIQQNGKFTIMHNSINFSPGTDATVQCNAAGGESQMGTAYPYSGAEPGLSGFETRYANVIFAATSTVNLPPQISIEGATLGENGNPLPEQEDPLKQYGKVQVGATVKITPTIIPGTATVNTPQLIINGVSQPIVWENHGNGSFALIPTSVAGRYSVVIKGRTNPNDPRTESVGTFNFIVLNNPNVRPPISGVNPAVVSVTPNDGSSQVDVGTSLHVEFSEPVKNLRSLSDSQTIYLTEEENPTEKLRGRILSGGIEITSFDARSVIDFIPNQRLKSGKNYKLVITTDVIDTNGGDASAVPPVPADADALRHLDQNTTESGWQEFSSSFKTFQGSIITPTPINAQGYKIAVLDDLVITTRPFFNGIASSGAMSVYDSTEFLDSSDPQNLQPVSGLYIPHVPLGLAAKKESYNIGGQNKDLNIVAVTTLSMDTARPRNVWFYNIDENREVRLVGVVSLLGNGSGGQVPNSISIEGKRAYIGSSTNGGVYVVDIQQAIEEFRAGDNTPDDGNEYNNIPVLQAVAQGGFGQSAIMQRAVYLSGNDLFQVYGVSTITQLLKPYTYTTSFKPKLLSFNFDTQNDGRLGFIPGGQNGRDKRVTADYDSTPVSGFVDVEAAAGLQIQGATKDIAVGVAGRLFIFDVTQPNDPKQYPLRQNEIDPQQPAKFFSELGVPLEVGSFGRQVEIEGTLVYVMFENGVGVFDISNPNEPYLTTLIRGLTGLRYLAVKDGFIYTLGSNGLNVSIGRAVTQVITYGYNPNKPDDVCGNPVVIRRDNNEMAQPVGVFFQIYGRDVPNTKKIVIRKVTINNNVRTEEIIGTTTDVQIVSSTPGGTTVGRGIWGGAGVEIDQSAIYTAQVVLDEDMSSAGGSKQVEIPFSYLIPEGTYQQTISLTADWEANNQDGRFGYLLAGNSKDVNLKIETENIILRQKSVRAAEAGLPKDDKRPFGQNLDYFRLEPKRADGTYQYTFSATLDVSPAYTERVTGTVQIGRVNDNLRQPGSTVVNGVEINSGNLAVSENELSIKGRGLSLEYTRSYNSQGANSFGTLGYGWRHSYQISLSKSIEQAANGNILSTNYRISGGEGSDQTFKEYPTSTSQLFAEAPYLGRLSKNADGSFDYFTKSQTRYHFQSAFDEGYPKTYYGNLKFIEEPNGNRITFAYDSDGKVLSVSDSSNRSLNFEYEVAQNTLAGVDPGEILPGAQGCPKISQYRRIVRRIQQSVTAKAYRIRRVTGTGGASINYTYDENGNLETATRAGTDLISAATGAREWRYGYYPAENGGYNKVHLLKTVKSPNNGSGDATTYSYYFGTTTLPRVMSIAMPEGITNSFVYDNQTNTDIINRATFTDGNQQTTSYELENNRVKTITAPLGAVTHLEWTDFGQIKKTIDPEGKTTEILFDNNNNPSTQTLTGGGETIQTVTTFDAKFSKMSSFKDGNNNTTSYEINQTTGNVDEITLPNGRTVLFHYFPNGDLKDVTDQYGTRTDFANYDSYGNPQAITKNLGGGQTQIITQSFDARSRQRSKSDNLGTNSTIQYDAFDRPTQQITEDPTGYRNSLTVETIYLPEGQPDLIVQKDGETELNRTKNTYDKLQRLTKTVETVSGYAPPFTRIFTYDDNSNLKTEQNRRGITTEKFYNALNHLTKIVQGTKTVWEATEVDRVGNPKTVKDLFGNQTTYVYDGLQRLKEKQLPEGVTEKLEYDNNNNITDSFDRNNSKTTYTYDELNRAATVTDALNRITKWTYTDATHTVEKESVSRRLVETTKMDGLERPVTQQIRFGNNNYQTSYDYDGRNVTVTDARDTVTKQKLSGFGAVGETEVMGATPAYKTTAYYTALGGVRQTTDALNRVTTVVNDGFNRQRSVNYNGEFSESFVYDGEGLVTEHTDRRGAVSTMSYDELGRSRTTIVRETVPTAKNITVQDYNYLDAENKEEITDANAHKTTLKYDGLRRVKEMTNADGKLKTYVYDGENLRSETDFYNRPTAYEYDKLNRVTKVYDRDSKLTTINYSADDLTKTTTDRRGNAFTEKYDALGRTLSSTDKLDNKIAGFTYDAGSNRLTQTDGNNNTTTFAYDKLSRLTSVTHPDALQTETFTYDAAGNVKTHLDGRGGTVESLEYNALNQLKKAKDGANNISEFSYDGGGLLLSQKDPKQNITTYKYNAFGSMTEVKEPGQTPWTLSYDDAQNLSSVKDPRQNTVGYQYDALNRLKKTTQPLDRSTEYVYDNNSNVTKVTDPKGQTAEMNYTALDDVDTATYKNAGNSTRLTLDYSYDTEQNLYRVDESRAGIVGTRTYTREFDERNRLTKNTDGANKTVEFGYDNSNNLKTLTDASNRITTYNYDGKNQLDTVVQNTNTIADYDWYSDGLLKKVAYQNNTNRNYVYDNADRVTNITNNLGANQSESYDYGYDANSNRESEIRKENGTAKRTASYQYDALDRLSNVDYTFNVAMPNPPLGQSAVYTENSEQNTYGYDAVGNRTGETRRTQIRTVTLRTDANGTTPSEQVSGSPVLATTATFNELNELTTLNEPSGISNFTYDNNGNLSQISKNNSVISKYEYDVRNQLTSAKDGANNELARFDYDFERKRIAKTSGNVTTNYTYAGSQVVNEYQGASLTATYGIGAGEIVKSEFASGENNFHYTDALGSVTSLTNNQGALTSRNEYNAFGELFTADGTANSIGYTGQRLDSETGLMALGNGERYYSPQYARFIQQDSFAGVSSMPQSLNRFAYGLNNPNKHTDPSGHIAPIIIAALIIGGIALLGTKTYEKKVEHDVAIIEGREKDNGQSTWTLGLSDAFGMTQLVNGVSGADSYTGKEITGWNRAWDIGAGAVQVVLNATMVGGAVFKAGSATINIARGTVDIAEVAGSAWSSAKGVWSEIKDYKPALESAKNILSKIRNPIDTAKAAWNATANGIKAGWKATSEFVGGGWKDTAKNAWEFTKERLNPFNYKFERVGTEINVSYSKVTVGSYRELGNLQRAGQLGENVQANHLNQNAVFKSVIPKAEGASNAMKGNAFTETGTPHYEFHRSLESFWDRFRNGGASFGRTPTNGEYGQAVETALRDGGLSNSQAARVANYAREQRISYGLLETDSVLNIPRRINQTGRLIESTPSYTGRAAVAGVSIFSSWRNEE
jgi:RHS repeat-associated protein